MKKTDFSDLIIVLLFTMSFFCGGCGGGGGGGGGSDEGVEPLAFSGNDNAALITSENTEKIVSSAFFAADTGATIGTIASSQVHQDDNVLDARILKVTQVFDDAIHQVDLSSDHTVTATITTENSTIAGDCGGSAPYTISVDNVAGTFSGTFFFRNYCENEIILAGNAVFSGSIDAITDDIFEFSLIFNNLRITSDGEIYRYDGDTFFDESGTPIIVDIDLLIQDPSGDVFWVNNYSLSLTKGPDYIDGEATGRFYHPDYGYVNFTTDVVFRIFETDDGPSSGSIFFEGDNGTTARLTAIDAVTARVTADTDGDGFDDFDTGLINWENL